MIKINLLNSVTERQNGAVIAVDRKISSSSSRLLLLSVVVTILLGTVIGWDIISTQMAKTEAERQLNEQKQIQSELESVMNEQKDLEAKIKNIDSRIDAIKKLRASQAGPSAVLEAVRERVTMVPGLYLDSIEQNVDGIVIKGNSPDEAQVTQFGRSLEFSNGLFTNLNIETARTDVANQAVTVAATSSNPDAGKMQIVNFTIKCAYTPSKANGASQAAPQTAAAQAPPAAPADGAQAVKN